MKELNCCECGTKFAMETSIYSDRLEDGNIFTCPNGHEQHFSESENKRLKDEIEGLKVRLESYQNRSSYWHGQHCIVNRSLSATKGVVTKLKKKLYPERYK